MRIELQSGGFRLAPGQLLKVREGAGTTVCAVEGSVWITEEDHPYDIVLKPSDCYRLRQPGLVLVQPANGEATLTFS